MDACRADTHMPAYLSLGSANTAAAAPSGVLESGKPRSDHGPICEFISFDGCRAWAAVQRRRGLTWLALINFARHWDAPLCFELLFLSFINYHSDFPKRIPTSG